jgi:hypothetical protein
MNLDVLCNAEFFRLVSVYRRHGITSYKAVIFTFTSSFTYSFQVVALFFFMHSVHLTRRGSVLPTELQNFQTSVETA